MQKNDLFLSEFNFLTTEFVAKIKINKDILIPVELSKVPALFMSSEKEIH